MRARKRVIIASVVVAGLGVQAGIGYLLWQDHVARQPKVTANVPYMDQAILAAVTGAGDTAAVAVSGIVAATQCRLDPFTRGGEFTRTADMYTDPGGEDALISRIAAQLPTNYHTQRPAVPQGQVAPLTADAGHGVRLGVSRIGEGWVVASARTSCTTAGGSQPVDGVPNDDAGTTTVTRLLSTLGTRPAELREQSVACQTGGNLVTVTAISESTATDHLKDRLTSHMPLNTHIHDTTANRVAYREGRNSTIIAASDDATAITIRHTTQC